MNELSFYPPLANLLNEVGKTLKPKVRAVQNIQNNGAGIPDFGLFAADQFQNASDLAPLPGALPARGVGEVKGALTIGYAPAYLSENADGIRQDWPRIPPPQGQERLLASAALLDTGAPVDGFTQGSLPEALKSVGTLAKVGGGQLHPSRAHHQRADPTWGVVYDVYLNDEPAGRTSRRRCEISPSAATR